MRLELSHKNINELLDLREFKSNEVIILFLNFFKSIDFNKINDTNSILEIDDDLNDASIFIRLESHVSIPLEISITKRYLDLSVSGCPIYEMFEIQNKNFIKEMEFLKKWFIYDIVNKVKYSDKRIVYSKFYNKFSPEDVIFKSVNLLGFLSVSRIEKIEYTSWIK